MSGRAVAALGVTQIVGYGTLYYAFPIAVPAMAATHSVTETWLYGVFSAGMLAGGIIAPRVGRAMDRHGAPRVMTVGSTLAAGLMALVPFAPDWIGLTVLILALELVAVAVLYDGAFATLALLRGDGARRAITQLTLIAGFASTLFWPLTGWLIPAIGWQATYGVFAVLNLAIALPLHLWLTRQPTTSVHVTARAPAAATRVSGLPEGKAMHAFWLVATGFALSGMLVAALGVHLVPLLQATGLGAEAYLVAMVMGPSQVAIRATDALFWKGLHPVDVALISGAALPLAVIALMLAGGNSAAAVGFAVLFGVGGGLSSIVRGTVPLALFGPQGFGALLGRLTFVRTMLSAVAPFLFALVMAQAGPQAAMGVAAAVGMGALVPLVVLRGLVRSALPR